MTQSISWVDGRARPSLLVVAVVTVIRSASRSRKAPAVSAKIRLVVDVEHVDRTDCCAYCLKTTPPRGGVASS